MEETPRWVDAVVGALEGCVEGYGPGSFDVRFIPGEAHLVITPALAEIVGGADDGEEVYPLFSVHLAELARQFDGLPEISWDTMHDELHVEGEIAGEDVWVTFQKLPCTDEHEPRWVIDQGRLRKRKSDE